jgi:hypothetical protein
VGGWHFVENKWAIWHTTCFSKSLDQIGEQPARCPDIAVSRPQKRTFDMAATKTGKKFRLTRDIEARLMSVKQSWSAGERQMRRQQANQTLARLAKLVLGQPIDTLHRAE